MIGRMGGMYCDRQSTDVALAISVGLDVYVAFVVNVFITLLTLAKYSQVSSWLLSLRMLDSCRSWVEADPQKIGQPKCWVCPFHSLSVCARSYVLTEQDGQGTYPISTHVMTRTIAADKLGDEFSYVPLPPLLSLSLILSQPYPLRLFSLLRY